ncbi:MAG: peptidylprolyl isomerase [Alphaproteobacteria bacterium]
MTASLEMLPMLSWKSLKLCVMAGCFVAPTFALAAATVPTPDVALKPFSAESTEDQQGPRLAIAAIVNDEVISGYDLDQRVKLLTNASGVQPSPEEMERIRAQVLRELIDEKLKLQEVKRLKVDIKDQEILDQLNYIASRNNTTAEDIKKQLGKQGISITTLTDQIKADIAWNELVQGRFGPEVSIDPGEVKRIMSEARSNIDKPQYNVLQIFLAVDSPDEDAKVKQRALDLLDDLKHGHPFTQVAQNFSQDSSAANGGDIGWVMQGQLAPELDAWLRTAHRGEVTPQPIKTLAGYYILAVKDSRNVAAAPSDPKGGFDMRQIILPLDAYASAETAKRARDQLIAVASKVKGCDKLEAAFASIPGAKVMDIGRRPVASLPPPFQPLVARLAPGSVSTDPLRTNEGWVTLAVCGKEVEQEEAASPGALTENDIKERLFEQQMSMLSRRYLRDLRRDAVIDSRIAEQ